MDKLLETKFGLVALRSHDDYFQWETEAMGGTAERTGAKIVLLLAPGVESITAEQAEKNIQAMLDASEGEPDGD